MATERRRYNQFPVYEAFQARFNHSVAQRNKLFGTDGVRGVANVEPVTAETALKLGRAAAHVFTQLNPREHQTGDDDHAGDRHAAGSPVTCWRTRLWPASLR